MEYSMNHMDNSSILLWKNQTLNAMLRISVVPTPALKDFRDHSISAAELSAEEI